MTIAAFICAEEVSRALSAKCLHDFIYVTFINFAAVLGTQKPTPVAERDRV
jgi:hypothetical protein